MHAQSKVNNIYERKQIAHTKKIVNIVWYVVKRPKIFKIFHDFYDWERMQAAQIV